jgi:hypothetical protein
VVEHLCALADDAAVVRGLVGPLEALKALTRRKEGDR